MFKQLNKYFLKPENRSIFDPDCVISKTDCHEKITDPVVLLRALYDIIIRTGQPSAQ